MIKDRVLVVVRGLRVESGLPGSLVPVSFAQAAGNRMRRKLWNAVLAFVGFKTASFSSPIISRRDKMALLTF